MITEKIRDILEKGTIDKPGEYYTLLKYHFGNDIIKNNLYSVYMIEFDKFFLSIPAIPVMNPNMDFSARNGEVIDLSYESFERFEYGFKPCQIKFYTYDSMEHDNFKDLSMHYFKDICNFKSITDDYITDMMVLSESHVISVTTSDNEEISVDYEKFDNDNLRDFINDKYTMFTDVALANVLFSGSILNEEDYCIFKFFESYEREDNIVINLYRNHLRARIKNSRYEEQDIVFYTKDYDKEFTTYEDAAKFYQSKLEGDELAKFTEWFVDKLKKQM